VWELWYELLCKNSKLFSGPEDVADNEVGISGKSEIFIPPHSRNIPISSPIPEKTNYSFPFQWEYMGPWDPWNSQNFLTSNIHVGT